MTTKSKLIKEMFPLVLASLLAVVSADFQDVFLQMQLPQFLPASPPEEPPSMDQGKDRICSFESIAGTPVHFVQKKVKPVFSEEINLERPSAIDPDEIGKFSMLLNDICALSCFENIMCLSAQRVNQTCHHFDVGFNQFIPQGARFMHTLYINNIQCMGKANEGDARELLGCSVRKLEGRPKRSEVAAVDDWLDGFLLINMTWVVPGWERQECARRCYNEPRCQAAHVYRSQCELFESDFRLTHTEFSIGTTLRDIKCPSLVPKP